MVKVEGLTVRYKTDDGYFTALENINLNVDDGDVLALVGPSGCGKSTLMHVLSGIINTYDGKVTINGEGINTKKHRIGLVLQDYGLLPWKNVYENAVLGLKIKSKLDSDDRDYALFILDKLGLKEFIRRYPQKLSGGQRQRVAIARALILKPDILLMDEPFSALDEITREEMQELFIEIQKEYNVSTVFVTHSIEEAVYIGKKIAIMSKSPGTIKQIIHNETYGLKDKRLCREFYDLTIKIRKDIKEEWST
ncbi:ABC transporter ATP-binding protein [Thermoanaerobacterium thermosaccharolyticum]|uniref:ABC-type nitrate/sulfonate/bicarbonate transport system, ATPase component n=1 Tax=Thermoanaerobacterium thermosaccharolyticum M0795 TaxID=698948 RepID=L0IIF9_THETR|nr:ABC transporter ATP-binding protein [Thermoanaerobacterium thermosaccharolyticum]AGB19280.1 ABC-type nitrate/sulfonate/bicarbonate transport system, ATPase component [Thermoanaerobacterium thermosaccharolyticum M0795]